MVFVFETVGVEDDESPRTRARDNEGKVNVLECPFVLEFVVSLLLPILAQEGASVGVLYEDP